MTPKNYLSKKAWCLITIMLGIFFIPILSHATTNEVKLEITPVIFSESKYRPVTDYLNEGESFNVEITTNKNGFMSFWLVDRTLKVHKVFPENNTGHVLAGKSYLASKKALKATGSSGYMRLVLTWTKKKSDQPSNVKELISFERKVARKVDSEKKLIDNYLAVYREADNIDPPLARVNVKAASSLRLTNPNPNGKVYILAMGANTDGLTMTNKDASDFGKAMSKLFQPASKLEVIEDTTPAEFKREMGSLARNVKHNDIVIVYFSGHGIKKKKSPIEDDNWDEAFQLINGDIIDDDFNRMLKRIKSKNILVVLDTCFAAGLYKNAKDVYGRLLKTSSSTQERTNRQSKPNSISRNKHVIVAASGENSAAREDPRSGGVFTTRITEAILDPDNAGKRLLTILQSTIRKKNPQYVSNPRFREYKGSTLGKIILKR